MEIFRVTLGMALFVLIAWAFSTDRKAVNWPLVIKGIVLQIVFGVLVIKVPAVRGVFDTISQGFVTFLGYARNGSQFVFGSLGDAGGNLGFIFAFQILPIIVFFAAVTSGLYYLGILQKLVTGIAWVMNRTLKISGAESLSVAGNIFLGQTEAPLLIKPFIKGMTRSELMLMMTGGMATLAGGVLAGYVSFLGGADPVEQTKYASYLLSASIMNAPAAVVMAKILVPEIHPELIDHRMTTSKEGMGDNVLDAMAIGAGDGMRLALNVGAMLIAFIGIIFAVNGLLGLVGTLGDINGMIKASTDGQFDALSLQYIFGQVFRVFAYMIGVDWNESVLVGSLLGEKTAINEFIAYSHLAELKNAGKLSENAIVISTYALCGFSNFSSIAIQIGGLGSLAPTRQTDISQLGLRALLGASIACLMTGAVAGMLL